MVAGTTVEDFERAQAHPPTTVGPTLPADLAELVSDTTTDVAPAALRRDLHATGEWPPLRPTADGTWALQTTNADALRITAAVVTVIVDQLPDGSHRDALTAFTVALDDTRVTWTAREKRRQISTKTATLPLVIDTTSGTGSSITSRALAALTPVKRLDVTLRTPKKLTAAIAFQAVHLGEAGVAYQQTHRRPEPIAVPEPRNTSSPFWTVNYAQDTTGDRGDDRQRIVGRVTTLGFSAQDHIEHSDALLELLAATAGLDDEPATVTVVDRSRPWT